MERELEEDLRVACLAVGEANLSSWTKNIVWTALDFLACHIQQHPEAVGDFLEKYGELLKRKEIQ